MENAIVFTGLPRMPDRFKRSVTEMIDLRRKGLIDRIVFATWQGRLNSTDDVRDFLEEAGVEIIERPEAAEGGQANIWHQMRALEFGLEALPEDARVLKTRSDVHIEPEFLAKLLAGEMDGIHSPAGSGTFSERIWVPGFVIDIPFYVCDYCFYGRKQDVAKLVNFDARFDFLYHTPGGLPEVRRYIHPYLDGYSFLRTYLRNYEHQNEYHLTDRSSLFESRLTSPLYGSILGFYYKVLCNDFRVHYAPVTFRDEVGIPLSIEDVSGFEATFLDNKDSGINQGKYDKFCQRHEWLAERFGEDGDKDVPKSILEGFRRPFEDWQSYEVPTDKLRTDVERDEQFYDITDYPEGPFINWTVQHALEPLGVNEFVKRLYRRVS